MISDKITETKNTILTPLITLPTPGKATVRVIILADPVRAFLSFAVMPQNHNRCYFLSTFCDI